ncbi:MAG TPA: hypothetical protein VGC98_03785 [Thermoleophilaceae bacterium]
MRKLLAGALVGAVVLAVAAIAYATTTATFNQSYINAKGKVVKSRSTSVGTSFATTSSEDQNAENNNQPKAAREFDVKFPAGSKVDTAAAPQCKNLDTSKDPPCPKNTKIGSGHAKVLPPFPGFAPIDAVVTAYNRKGGLWLHVVAQGNQVKLKPTFKGLTLKTAVPPTCIPPATDQGGQCKDAGGNPGKELILTEFDLKTKPAKKGKHVFLKTPASCPKSKQWKFAAHIEYSDGSKADYPAVSPCK